MGLGLITGDGRGSEINGLLCRAQYLPVSPAKTCSRACRRETPAWLPRSAVHLSWAGKDLARQMEPFVSSLIECPLQLPRNHQVPPRPSLWSRDTSSTWVMGICSLGSHYGFWGLSSVFCLNVLPCHTSLMEIKEQVFGLLSLVSNAGKSVATLFKTSNAVAFKLLVSGPLHTLWNNWGHQRVFICIYGFADLSMSICYFRNLKWKNLKYLWIYLGITIINTCHANRNTTFMKITFFKN